MKKYTIKNGAILKDGHTMFLEDVLKELARLKYLEDVVGGSGVEVGMEVTDELLRKKRHLEQYCNINDVEPNQYMLGSVQMIDDMLEYIKDKKWITKNANIPCPECGYPTFRRTHEEFDRCEGCDWDSQ